MPRANREPDFKNSPAAWTIAAGCAAVILLALVAPRGSFKRVESQSTVSAQLPARQSGARPSTGSKAPATLNPEEIVAGKVAMFARDRLRIARAMAKRIQAELPAEVEQFFNAVAAGQWEELNLLFEKLKNLRDSGSNEKLRSIWGPILECMLIAECAHEWPAQKLLDYGQATLGSLRPGMIYVGGTDPGRGIPTLLNETSGGERHIVLTQNGLADGTYVDYLRFLYGDQLALPTEEETKKAFDDYIADAQKRFEHDRLFPNEPKQVKAGEQIQPLDSTDGNNLDNSNPKIQVSGNLAVMAINERILAAIMDKNPGMSFALEESFPLTSTYGSAAPLGPLMELRAANTPDSFTLDTAGNTLEYWRTAADELSTDPEAPEGSAVRKTYSHMASAQANLLAEHNYTDEAEQTYRLAMQMEPDNREAVYNLANLLGKTGRLDEARLLLQDFQQAHPGQSGMPEASIILGAGPTN